MGTSAMAQIRQFAAPGDRTSGCMGHQNSIRPVGVADDLDRRAGPKPEERPIVS